MTDDTRKLVKTVPLSAKFSLTIFVFGDITGDTDDSFKHPIYSEADQPIL
ncbi:hypothetical protein ACFQH8_00040 [Halomicroarcula sp. GCM10025710]